MLDFGAQVLTAFFISVFLDEEVKAEVEVSKIEGRKVTFNMTCTVLESNKVWEAH